MKFIPFRLNTNYLPSIRLLLLFVSIGLLASCASKVRTNITTFKNETASFEVGTIHISQVAERRAEAGLEFEFYKKRLSTRLEAMGYKVVNDSSADYLAFLDYSVRRREKETNGSNVQIGLGYGHFSRFGRVVFTEPFSKEFEYVRRVQLGIEKNIPKSETPPANVEHKLVEIDAVSLGRCPELTQVFEPMLDAIFENLLRDNGSTKRVVVPGHGTCK